MKRRTFLAAGGALACTAVGASGAVLNNGAPATNAGTASPSTAAPAPETVTAVEPLATAFYDRIINQVAKARVFITQQGELALEYRTAAENVDALNTEFNQIAVEYADVVRAGEYDPVTLSIITDEVQAIVTKAALAAFIRGDLNREAYLETLEVTGIERPDA